jgi:hypothetical protein
MLFTSRRDVKRKIAPFVFLHEDREVVDIVDGFDFFDWCHRNICYRPELGVLRVYQTRRCEINMDGDHRHRCTLVRGRMPPAEPSSQDPDLHGPFILKFRETVIPLEQMTPVFLFAHLY